MPLIWSNFSKFAPWQAVLSLLLLTILLVSPAQPALATPTLVTTIKSSYFPVGSAGPIVQHSATGRLYMVDNAGVMRVLNSTTFASIGTPLQVANNSYDLALNSAGTRLFVSNAGTNSISVIDTATNQRLNALGETPKDLALPGCQSALCR